MLKKIFPIKPARPERVCWGCDRYCPGDDMVCGNGSERTQHPCELSGDEWEKEWAIELDPEMKKCIANETILCLGFGREMMSTSRPVVIDFPGHHAPNVGFEVPLEMLVACHYRVQSQCETLLRLVIHMAEHGCDPSAQETVISVMRYFDTAALHHHEDEEQDLFPALLESMAGSDAMCLRELTASLTSDHIELERCWRALRLKLERVAGGSDVAWADDEVPSFIGRYKRHIELEETKLLPMAQRLLSDSELDRIGLAMRMRREAFELS